jgi:hypothetical protein
MLINRTTLNNKLETPCPPLAGNSQPENLEKAGCEKAVVLIGLFMHFMIF